MQRADGSVGVITGWQPVSGTKTMYNLEVQQDHTFVVGDGQWVVHNQCDSRLLGNNLGGGLPGQQAHHVVPCATFESANADPDAKAFVQLAMDGGFDINGKGNGRWMWSDPATALANNEAYHANAPAYQGVVNNMLGGIYRMLLRSGALDPSLANNLMSGAIQQLNARIDELGRLAQTLGRPVGLC